MAPSLRNSPSPLGLAPPSPPSSAVAAASSASGARSLGKGYSFGHGAVELDDSSTAESESSSSTSTPETVPPPSPPADHLLLGGEPSPFDDAAEELRSLRAMWTALTADERAALPEPSVLARHLRAENGSAEAALDKVRTTLQWRREFGVDGLLVVRGSANTGGGPDGEGENDEKKQAQLELDEMLHRENCTGKIYVRGYDAEGRALLYMRAGRENTHCAEDNMKHLVWNLEKAVACTGRKSVEVKKEKETPLEKINLVIDYAGFRLKDSPPLSTSKRTLEILQDHYPERMHRAYVLNPPLYFKTFWTIIRPFVDPHTKQKIVMVSNRATREQLLEAIGDEGVRKLETVAGGPSEPHSVRDFDSSEYLRLPFDVSFDECVEI